MEQQYGTISLKWDPKNIEIRTTTVEKSLEPLIQQVTTLVNSKGSARAKKGKSKRAHILVAAVERATENFIKNGKIIAMENPDIRDEMLSAVEEVRVCGDAMSVAAREFADDPCSSVKRSTMVMAARKLLAAVTRLLVLADMVDVHLLLTSLQVAENELAKLKNASDSSALMDSIRAVGASLSDLMNQAMRRQQELKDPQMKDALAAARATLKKNSTMLMTASTVYLKHPELAAAKANRDYVLKQMCEAVTTISDVAQGRPLKDGGRFEGMGLIAAALDDFEDNLRMRPLDYDQVRTRALLEEQLESIITAAAQMADSSCTRDDHRSRIVEECNNVRQALQDLLSEYMDNMGHKEPSAGLERALDNINHYTKGLRRQMRKAVVDHVSDGFLETTTPLIVLIEAARAGNEAEVNTYAPIFSEHAAKLVEVAHLACSMSANEEGVKMVRAAAAHISNLCPQVINAAEILAARPQSQAAKDNMQVFRQAWESQVQVLTEAVDDITTIDDFLAVSESHILEDVNKCVLAVEEGDPETLSRTADAIRGRSARVCSVVTAEMSNYDPSHYTDRVLKAVNVLNDQVMPTFTSHIEIAVNGMSEEPKKEVDNNEVIHVSQLVYDGVRDIRCAVLMNRSDDELDPDEVIMEDHFGTWSNYTDNRSDGFATLHKNVLPEEDKQKINQQIANFRTEKLRFDQEVAKWDETGNDVIVLAKHMCVIMMEMTDFTRGRGPLRTTMDVINAAKKISEAGTKLDKLTRQIAEQCPESQTKEDLLAYLQRIALYCHQLNITSKVKADVQNISGELIVSGLDSATSLIQAAKNLMNAVVLTVKSSYVASTKYSRQGHITSPLVVWKMKAPEKKPLVRPVKPEEAKARVQRASKRKSQNPIKALTEFQNPVETL